MLPSDCQSNFFKLLLVLLHTSNNIFVRWNKHFSIIIYLAVKEEQMTESHDLDTQVLDRVVDALEVLCNNFEQRLEEQLAEYICQNRDLLKTSTNRINQQAPEYVEFKNGRCHFKDQGWQTLIKMKEDSAGAESPVPS